jgi:hypothetical protein
MLLETLIRAKYTKQRQRLLEEANLTLEVLRFQIRLPKDLQCLADPTAPPGPQKPSEFPRVPKRDSKDSRDRNPKLGLAQCGPGRCGPRTRASVCNRRALGAGLSPGSLALRDMNR